jgi:hypothetical protein
MDTGQRFLDVTIHGKSRPVTPRADIELVIALGEFAKTC